MLKSIAKFIHVYLYEWVLVWIVDACWIMETTLTRSLQGVWTEHPLQQGVGENRSREISETVQCIAKSGKRISMVRREIYGVYQKFFVFRPLPINYIFVLAC